MTQVCEVWRRVAVFAAVCASALLQGAERVPWTSNRISGSPNPPAPFVTARVFGELRFQNPVDFCVAPGTDRIAVLEQGGKLWSFVPGENPKAELAIDFRKVHSPFGESLGFTFDPGFASNGFVYVNINEPGGRENGAHVMRFKASGGSPLAIDGESKKEIISWLSGGHNGCTLVFGNDGLLYISTGDAADPDPPDSKRNTGQDISDLLASVLRINVHPIDETKPYEVPWDNPFVKMQGARPEVWAFGFRNPFRMSIDRATGGLWVADVGWEQWEMVYHVTRGGNYGWPIVEGPNKRAKSGVTQGPGEILAPVHSVPHTDGASITGGWFYYGNKLPKIRAAYIYGDWETGKFWALRQDGGKLISNEEICDTSLKPSCFGIDKNGELLILDYNGGFYEFRPNTGVAANAKFPRKLSETGLYASLNPLKPAEGTVTYQPNAPMWNDYATAEWLLGVPGDAQAATSGGLGNIAGGTWYFPTNSALARTLTLEMTAGDAVSKRRIETQLLHWDGQGWNPYTYRWNEAQTDAELVEASGTNIVLTVKDARSPGGIRETPWRFHSRTECLRCHNAWAGDLLSLNFAQLKSADGGGELKRLEDFGVLKVRERRDTKPLVNPYGDGDVKQRARAWLDVNCSTCHRFGAGSGGVTIHLNMEKKDDEMRVINEKPSRGDFGLEMARIVAEGNPHQSALYYRINTEGGGRMPHIGSRLVDPRGVELIRQWIGVAAPAGLVQKIDSTSDGLRALDHWSAGRAQRDEVVKLAMASTNALVRDLFQRLLPPEQRRRTLGSEFDPNGVLALKGDAARGKEIFVGVAQCARCHVASGEGKAFGPELSAIGKKYDRAALLDHVTHPSKTIAPEFKLTTVMLKDDTEANGFVVKRSTDEIVIREEAGERKIKVSDVDKVRDSALSAMPEGMLAALTAQEAADLIEFLASNKQ